MAVSKLRIAIDTNVTLSGAQTIQTVALVPAAAEVAAYTITSAADADGGNVLVNLGNLDGTTTTYTVPVAAADSAVVVAGKIAGLAGGYAEHTAARRASPNDHIVDFTATAQGARPDASYSPSTGGATGTVSTTTQGAAGDIVLPAAQNNGAENGVYVVQTGTWTRHLDYDTAAEFLPRDPSTEWMIDDGKYRGWRWRFANDTAPTTLGTDILNFVPYLRPGVEEAGVGIEEEDGVFSLPDLGVVSGTYGTDAPLTVSPKGQVVDAVAARYGSETYIRGLTLFRASTNEVVSRVGALWIPSGQQVYHRTGTGTYLVPSNAAVGLRYFYWHVSGTALFFEGTTTPPANLSYVTGASGSGAKVISSPTVLGTTADQYRYVGAVLVAAGGTVYRFSVHGDGDILEIAYLTDTTVSPFRIITDGTATTNTLVDCSPVVPLNSREVRLMVRNRSDKTCLLVFRDFGEVMMRVPAGLEAPVWVTINANRVFEYRLASAPNAGGVTFDVLGYRDRR